MYVSFKHHVCVLSDFENLIRFIFRVVQPLAEFKENRLYSLLTHADLNFNFVDEIKASLSEAANHSETEIKVTLIWG